MAMKWLVCSIAALALLAGVPALAGDIEFKPVDTKKLVVVPSKVAANLAAGTINLVGQTTASSLEGNGWVKTINNLFSVKKTDPKFQAGPSALPSPNLYKSTMYKNYNTPVMPTYQQVNRRCPFVWDENSNGPAGSARRAGSISRNFSFSPAFNNCAIMARHAVVGENSMHRMMLRTGAAFALGFVLVAAAVAADEPKTRTEPAKAPTFPGYVFVSDTVGEVVKADDKTVKLRITWFAPQVKGNNNANRRPNLNGNHRNFSNPFMTNRNRPNTPQVTWKE